MAINEVLVGARRMAEATIELGDRISPGAFVTPAEESAGYLIETPGALDLITMLSRVGDRAHRLYENTDTRSRVSVIMSPDLPGSIEPELWQSGSLGLRAVVLAGYWEHLWGGKNRAFAPLDRLDAISDNEEVSDKVGIRDSVTAIATTAQAAATGHDATALTAKDLVVYPVLDLEHEAEVRRMLESLPELVTTAIEDGAFDHDEILRNRVTTDRNFLAEQMRQSGPGELRLPVVAPLVNDLIKTLASTKPDDPEATVVIDVAEAAGPNEFNADAAIRQRDEVARTSGKPKSVVDDLVFAYPIAISTTGAVAGLYGSAVAGQWAGALLGILVAVLSAVAVRRIANKRTTDQGRPVDDDPES